MSGAMSGVRTENICGTILATRRRVNVLDWVRVGLYSLRFHKGAFPKREAHMEPLMSIRDAQDYLRVSRSTVYRFLKRHHLRPVYVLGCVRFRRADIEAALESQRGYLR